jgi:hypothetical protein
MIIEGGAEENIVKCLQIEFSLISTLLDLYVSVLDMIEMEANRKVLDLRFSKPLLCRVLSSGKLCHIVQH